MRRLSNSRLVWIGAVSAALIVAPLCPADEWSANGIGTTPMTPSTGSSDAGLRQRPVVSGSPAAPIQSSRGASWPGSQPAASAWPSADPNQAALPVDPSIEMKPCEGLDIIARVGSEAILASEVIGGINELLEKNKDKIPASQLEAQRNLLIQQRLRNRVETKLIFQDAKKTVPAEGWTQIEKQLAKQFDSVELDKMLKRAGVQSRHELDQKLRALGTSLEREKKSFMERTLAQQWVRQQVKHDEEVTYTQMVNYYHEHQDEFTKPARARWEELMVRYAKYPSKVEAHDAIAQIGNQVAAGAPLANVAKAGSDGGTAADGGRRDWTTKGSLVCEAIDQALFTLPVGQLSPIIEGPTGYHIIRVTEREEIAVAPFLSAQVDIREKILQKRSEQQFKEYMAKLEAKTPVWTVFDGQPDNLISRRPDQLPNR